MELQIKTLTPLWTGGEAGKVDRIHETGILGSLRWWYEAIVRGLGGKACDPSAAQCLYDPQKPNNGLCDVCRVFGATGWRRRFRLTIADHTNQDTSSSKQITASRPTNPKTNRKPTWWLPDHPRSGNLTIQIQSLAPDFPAEVAAGLIQFIADWTALGARAQMGFGVIEVENGPIDTRPLYEGLISTAGSHPNATLPSLRNLFLARISPKDGGQFSEQETFNLKYDLHQLFANDRALRHFIMGTASGKRIAAKVKLSRPYGDGLVRVWGWIPEQANEYRGSWNRRTVVDAIYQHLNHNYSMQVWREMSSPWDTAIPNGDDAPAFLRDLLAIEEEADAA